MSVKGIADTVYAYRFLRMLTTSWVDMDAYKLGIVDENGKVLKKASTLSTPAEKEAYTYFHRLIFNVKRLLEKLPFGKSKLGSFATALFLIKEHSTFSEAELKSLFLEDLDIDFSSSINEEWFIIDTKIDTGVYKLKEEVVSPKTFEVVGKIGDSIVVEKSEYIDSVFGINIYEAKVNGHTIFVSAGILEK